MNQVIENLESEVKVLELELTEFRKIQWEIYNKLEEKYQTYFTNIFKPVIPETITLEASSRSVRFLQENKEIFNLYLNQNYAFREHTSDGIYENIELSYYTTDTSTDFEMNRLISLGNVAEFLMTCKDRILDTINQEYRLHLEELKASEIHDKINEVEWKIREVKYLIKSIRTNEKLELLKGEGLTFEVPKKIYLKRGFEVRVKKLKISEVSSSGKTCIVDYWYDGYDYSREERNVKYDLILDQVV